MKGYIYIRTNEWCELKEVYKVGITTSIKDRNNSYITGEIIRGNFLKIFELDVNNIQLKYIDKIIKFKFRKLNVYFDGGTEFYNKIIINKIDDFLLKNNIKFKLVNEKELNRINRKNNKSINDIIKKYIQFKSNINPKIHQKEILNNIQEFYKINNIGNLIWACGLGKSLMSILIIQKLNFKKIIIGVPSNFLQLQFANEILQIFPNKYNILIGSSKDTNNIIKSFLSKKTEEPLFIITTYHSCYLYINDDFIFDFKIADECHHLVGKDNNVDKKRFILFHKIISRKSLYMTATIKNIINNDDKSYSMENEEIFGETIDEKTFKWAIDNNMITDYKIIIIQNQLNELMEIKHRISSSNFNKELFICVYLTLKSLIIFKENSPSHILIYTNEIKDAELAKNYIKEILNYGIIDINPDDLYYNSLHSQLDNEVIKNGFDEFNKSKYGIISCVQLFGEGINCPIIDGITIASNMISEIKIVQYLLRANRLYYKNPNKIAYYIIPYLSNENYSNISHIIRQLRNYDERIEQKIMVSSIVSFKSIMKLENKFEYEIIQNPELLLKIKMKLRNSKDLTCDFTEEENEYNYIKSINKSLKLNSRIDYENSKDIHENFIENPNRYFLNKGVWINWCDFLGYDTSNFIPTKQKWINFCKEKEVKSIDDYKKLLSIYNELPKDPEDFYNDFSNFSNELGLITKIKRR
jgi:predicted helicase